MLKYKLPFLLLFSTTALANTPCDYKVDDKIIYEGHIESVRLVSKSVETIPKIKDIRKCMVSIEARVDDKWYPSKGEYMFGPDMSQMDACTHAEDRAKKQVMREKIPETLKSEKNLNCSLMSYLIGTFVVADVVFGKVKMTVINKQLMQCYMKF